MFKSIKFCLTLFDFQFFFGGEVSFCFVVSTGQNPFLVRFSLIYLYTGHLPFSLIEKKKKKKKVPCFVFVSSFSSVSFPFFGRAIMFRLIYNAYTQT